MGWTISDSYLDALAISPSATPLAQVTRGIWVGAAGSMTVTTANGTSVTIAAIPAGTLIPLRISAFTAGTATSVLALY